MKKNTYHLLGVAVLVVGVVLPFAVGAIGIGNPNTAAPNPPITQTTQLQSGVGAIFNLLFWLLTVAAIFFVLFAAYKYLTASGDPEKMKEANKQILYAAIAVAVAIVAKGVPALVKDILSSFGGSST